MRIPISFKGALLLGMTGWLLVAYPRTILLYHQISSGEVLRVGYRYLSGGTVDSGTAMVGLSLLPVGPLLFLAILYLEAAGILKTALRRIGSGLAGGLILLTAYWSMMLPFTGYDAEASGAYYWPAWLFTGAAFLSWAVLMGVFAIRRNPLQDRITARVVEFIGLAYAIQACITLALMARAGFRLRHPLGPMIDIAAAVLIVVFAISTRQTPPARANVA